MSEQKRFDDYFNEVFDDSSEKPRKETECLSPMARKLKERKEKGVITHYESWLQSCSDYSNRQDLSADFQCTYTHSLLERGMHFPVLSDPDFEEYFFQVFVGYSMSANEKYYYVKQMETVCDKQPDGVVVTTVFVDDVHADGDKLIVLRYDRKNAVMLINEGILDPKTKEVRLAKKPVIFEISGNTKNKTQYSYNISFEALTNNQIDDFLTGVTGYSEYEIDIDSTIITIDLNAGKVVTRSLEFQDGMYKARIKIKSGGHPYFSFQVRPDTGNDYNLSEYQKAKCYCYGLGDFPKDKIKAAEMFEQIGDADSIYELAHIWLDESHNDVESLQDGIACLEEAARQGHDVAKAELVYYLMKLLCMLPVVEQETIIDEYHEQIKCAVDTELPGAMYLAAYVYEKGMFVDRDTDLAFSYYFRAAKAGNDAAKARIGMAPIGNYQSETECRNFFMNSVDTIGLAEYFMGWFLADDPDVMVVTEDILYFYEIAANSGILPAIKELAEVYMSGNSYIEADPAIAIMWYEKLSDIDDDTAVKLANYYLDGKGCVAGPESDAKAFALLKKTVATYKNGTAYNNLSWMYKKGRGCEKPDYATALILFEKAAELECRSAFYHLGDIYEHGLGIKPDLKKAWAYYQMGAELGNQKCIDIVKREFPQEYEAASNAQVLSVLTDIQGRTVRMEQKLDQLLNYVENELSTVIAEAKKKVQDHPADDDAAVADFIESTSTYINQTMTSPDALVEQETEQLKLLFGKSWNLLLPASKASLISAGVLWKSCARITKPGFDFSGVCISATSALEMELKHIFYSGFQAFLEERYGTPTTEKSVQTFRDWPEILLSCSQYEFQKKKGNATLAKGNYFTLGKLPYILGKPEKFRNVEKENLLRTRLIEYLRTIVIDKYSNDPISAFYNTYDPNCFVNRCEFINNAYRIKAAHADVIEREQADDCYRQVIGKVDALKYTSDVTGLIIELYDMLK